MSDIRNTLTHEALSDNVDLKEAINFFHHARLVVKELAYHFNDASIELCKTPWHDFPEI
ncbi:hypothetical protein [Psychrobacter sp. FDAARGOS_221]|uniref:hypothetical protein n=1 Tax=Psychrobacter sp. FDAARGOS_221 TaxID=1975705 RepID=UPI00187D364F|nr:hypothetical protein [Psychrobacter sp. FDAARGOS_221]